MSREVHVRFCEGLGVRFPRATRLVVVCCTQQQATQAEALIAEFLRRLNLNLHTQKTGVVDLRAGGFDFLGFHFHKLRSKRTGRLVPYAWPSQKAMKAIRDKVRRQTERTRAWVDLGELVGILNRVIVGWRRYSAWERSKAWAVDLLGSLNEEPFCCICPKLCGLVAGPRRQT